MKSFNYITVDPAICHGAMTFRGTRVLVADIIDLIAEGKSWLWIGQNFPGVSFEAIEEALRLASKVAALHRDEMEAQVA